MTQAIPQVAIISQYLDEIQSNIRVRPVPWEGYVRANLLSTSEAGLIKSIEKQPRDRRLAIVEKDPKAYASTVIGLVRKITRDDVVKYILSLTADLAGDLPLFADSLLDLSLKDKSLPYEPFVKLLDNSDEAIHLLSAKSLVILLSAVAAPKQYVEALFTFLSKLASSADSNLQDIAVQSYGILLRPKWYRKIFWSQAPSYLPSLINILKNSRGNVQLSYYTLLVLWLLSFEPSPAAELISKFDLVPVLFDTIKNSVKEKIIRLSVATIVNTVTLAPTKAIPSLLVNSGLSLVKTLADRKWADEELIQDLATLSTSLQEAFDTMSGYDEYVNEVQSKALRWSPPHRSVVFWKENTERFKDADWKILKSLASIVLSSNDSIVLAVACNDISHIAAELPDSIKVLERTGAKIKIMELMNHADPEVRYEALKATQTFVENTFK